MRSFVVSLLCAASLLSARVALASAPPDPFGPSTIAAPGAFASPLLDPFALRGGNGTTSSTLKDPFAVAPPACPVRTTESGVVVQRPAGLSCTRPDVPGLRDPWRG